MIPHGQEEFLIDGLVKPRGTQPSRTTLNFLSLGARIVGWWRV